MLNGSATRNELHARKHLHCKMFKASSFVNVDLDRALFENKNSFQKMGNSRTVRRGAPKEFVLNVKNYNSLCLYVVCA